MHSRNFLSRPRPMAIAIMLLVYIQLQATEPYTDPDSLARTIPDRVTRSVSSFSAWLQTNFPDDLQRVKALYCWLATRVVYDVEMARRPVIVESLDEVVRVTLSSRKGVCQHYAETFTAVCRAMEIPAFTVHGYTRIDGKILSNQGHAWNVAKIGETWYLFDASWGSGFVEDRLFRKAFSWEYYMIQPDSLIRTHIPFDPIWQLKTDPITHREFLDGKISGKRYMNMADSIEMYSGLPEIQQAEGSLSRAISMELDLPELTILARRFIAYTEDIRSNYYISLYNEAVTALHTAVDDFNASQELLMKQPIPVGRIRELLLSSTVMAQKSREQIVRIKPGKYVTEKELRSFLQDILTLEEAIREARKDSSLLPSTL